MTNRNTNKPSRATGDVRGLTIYPDSSGAPCTVSFGRYTFAFDFVGELKCRLLAPEYGVRRENKIAREICERTYLAALHATATDEWFVANREMYLPEAADVATYPTNGTPADQGAHAARDR